MNLVDEIQKKCAAIDELLQDVWSYVLKAEKERDEARRLAEEWRDWGMYYHGQLYVKDKDRQPGRPSGELLPVDELPWEGEK